MKKTTNATVAPLPLIDIAGKPHERGLQYGRQAAQYIRRCLGLYRPAFERGGLDARRVRRIAAVFLKRITAYAPDMAAEIKGIAAGARLSVEDIVAINARTEMLYAYASRRRRSLGEEPDDGCTGALALPPATLGNRVLHGQNWDWRYECKDFNLMLRIRPDHGPAVLTMVEAGMLARSGMNSEGVALTGNYLQCEEDSNSAGVPLPLVRRNVLGSSSLRDAMYTVYNAPRSFSSNMIISHEGGEGVNLEATPGEVFWAMPEQCLIVHANHFTSVGALTKLKDVSVAVTPDSLYRLSRVRTQLQAKSGVISVADFRSAFGDRYGAPYAVCRSPVEDVARGKKTSTVATIIMDVGARRLWVAPTPYLSATATYWEYNFDAPGPIRYRP